MQVGLGKHNGGTLATGCSGLKTRPISIVCPEPTVFRAQQWFPCRKSSDANGSCLWKLCVWCLLAIVLSLFLSLLLLSPLITFLCKLGPCFFLPLLTYPNIFCTKYDASFTTPSNSHILIHSTHVVPFCVIYIWSSRSLMLFKLGLHAKT